MRRDDEIMEDITYLTCGIVLTIWLTVLGGCITAIWIAVRWFILL